MTIRFFSILIALCATCAPGALAQTSTAVAYKYANLTFPGATTTSANGINNGNVVVGAYTDSSNASHGYIYSAGTYTAVNYPGAAQTSVLGISDYNDIVGWYMLPGPSNLHGFRRHAGTFTSINYPGAQFGTVAAGINKGGTIVGSFDNSEGFIYQNGTYTKFDAPVYANGSPDTQLNGINNLGQFVGQVFSGDNWRGFWVTGSDLDFLQPLFATDNQVTGINGRGDIVGCHDVSIGFISFAVESGEGSESTERFPRQQSLAGCASGINYARVVVGNYWLGNAPQAFLGTPALTLNVTSPVDHSSNTNPVHVAATASGVNPISQIQVWVNYKQIYRASGGTLNANITFPVGTNERLVIQAVDSKGVAAKVVETINVH